MIDAKEIQPLNAWFPILTTEFGITIDESEEQESKALLAMVVAVLERTTFVSELQYPNVNERIAPTLFGIIIDGSAVHWINAESPIDVNELGKFIVCKEVQYSNAVLPMLVRLLELENERVVNE